VEADCADGIVRVVRVQCWRGEGATAVMEQAGCRRWIGCFDTRTGKPFDKLNEAESRLPLPSSGGRLPDVRRVFCSVALPVRAGPTWPWPSFGAF
jgi:hypothetical protein